MPGLSNHSHVSFFYAILTESSSDQFVPRDLSADCLLNILLTFFTPIIMLRPLLVLLCVLSLATANNGPTAYTRLGQIEGSVRRVGHKTVEQFLGIPYAEPPVAHLRFKKPSPLTQRYKKPLDATKFSASCRHPEYKHLWPLLELQNLEEVGSNPKFSEDCLYLNIWTPGVLKGNFKKQLKAVLVWIHGGGFLFGSSTQTVYDGAAVAAYGDIVVVSMNYRLGTLGFLYTGDGEDDAPGNMGLWDQATAFRWVHENIKFFGGDPKRVTISGESAGGMSCHFHLMSSISKKLFQSAIPLSGSSVSMGFNIPKDVALKRAMKLAQMVNCSVVEDKIDMECMGGIDAQKLSFLGITKDLLESDFDRIFTLFNMVPIFGDDFLPVNPQKILKSSIPSEHKRIMTGVTEFEGGSVIILPQDLLDPRLKRLLRSDRLNDIILVASKTASGIRRLFSLKGLKNVLSQLFYDSIDHSDVNDNNSTESMSGRFKANFDMSGDVSLLCPALLEAQKYSENNQVYSFVYTFRFQTRYAKGSLMSQDCPIDKYGVCHSSELHFFFGMPLLYPSHYTEDEKDAAREIISITSDFIKGRPLSWPEYKLQEDGTRVTRVISGRMGGNEILVDFKKDKCNFLRKIIL